MKFSQNVANRGETLADLFAFDYILSVYVLCGNYANIMHMYTYTYISTHVSITGGRVVKVNTNNALEAT